MVTKNYNYRERGKCTDCNDVLWSWPNQEVLCSCRGTKINGSIKTGNITTITDTEMETYIRSTDEIDVNDEVVINQL